MVANGKKLAPTLPKEVRVAITRLLSKRDLSLFVAKTYDGSTDAELDAIFGLGAAKRADEIARALATLARFVANERDAGNGVRG